LACYDLFCNETSWLFRLISPLATQAPHQATAILKLAIPVVTGSANIRGHQRQIFFDLLIEPSLQTNFSPEQCDIPPFLPEHGLFAAVAVNAKSDKHATKITFFMIRPSMGP
jgi:hypothetical protein